MATLYFNNAVDSDWNTLGNWWDDEACTDPAAAKPIATDSVVLLMPCDQNGGAAPTVVNVEVRANMSLGISLTVTGLATFLAGSYYWAGTLTGNCLFSGASSYSAFGGTIVGDCDYTGDSSYNESSITGDCVFSGNEAINLGTITGGAEFSWDGTYTTDFWGAVSGTITISGDIVREYSGTDSHAIDDSGWTISGSMTWRFKESSDNAGIIGSNSSCEIVYPHSLSLSGPVACPINLVDYPQTHWFWRNANANNSWNDAGNWFTDLNGVNNAVSVPWIADNATKAYHLHRSKPDVDSGGEIVNIDASIGDGFEITGECDIGYISSGILTNYSSIYGGTFSGDGFVNNNYSSIYGGTFSGDGFDNNNSSIYGGTFSGDGFVNNYNSYIYGGTFSGALFTNYSQIYSGSWLESGNLLVAVNDNGTVTYETIVGRYTNPQNAANSTGGGFTTIKGGSDIIGSGLL